MSTSWPVKPGDRGRPACTHRVFGARMVIPPPGRLARLPRLARESRPRTAGPTAGAGRPRPGPGRRGAGPPPAAPPCAACAAQRHLQRRGDAGGSEHVFWPAAPSSRKRSAPNMSSRQRRAAVQRQCWLSNPAARDPPAMAAPHHITAGNLPARRERPVGPLLVEATIMSDSPSARIAARWAQCASHRPFMSLTEQ